MHAPRLGFLGLCAVLAVAGSPSAPSSPIIVTARFEFQSPDGSLVPIAGALCSLIDVDPIADDLVTRSMTDDSGRVTFTYDSGLWDGVLGGRIDPLVRCYSRWLIQPGDQIIEQAAIVHPNRSPYALDTETWENNNENRSVTVSLTDQTNLALWAFSLMDIVARANARAPKPGGTLLEAAPMALKGTLCASGTRLVFPSVLSTSFLSPANEIMVEWKYRTDAETVWHEYGHHEMWNAYGGIVFGNYERTQDDHSFSGVLDDGTLKADAAWTAFAEGWADFAAVVTNGSPRYRTFDVEADDTIGSPRCEGTICRIFWDLWDTAADPTVDENGNATPRPIRGGAARDDDAFGYLPVPPFSGLPGRNQLKAILRNDRPRSLADFRAAFNRRYAYDSLTRRAFDAVLYRNGIRDGITDTAPQAVLTVEGTKHEDTYAGTLRLQAIVSDADITTSTPEDGRLMHVTFFWANFSSSVQAIDETPLKDWHVIATDIDGRNGWSCEWRDTEPGRPDPKQLIMITAVASDFFQDSAYGLKSSGLTAAQAGPFHVEPAPPPPPTGGGGNPLPEESGPLAEESSFYSGIGLSAMRVTGDVLLLSNGYQGLKIYDVARESVALLSTFKPARSVFTDACHDADVFRLDRTRGANTTYAALAFGSRGLRILDISDPRHPVEIGALESMPERAPYAPTGLNARIVRARPPYAYVAGNGLSVIDVSDPARPRDVSYWHPAKQGLCREITEMQVLGSLAYLACPDTGLNILDLEQAGKQRVYTPALARRDPSLKLPESMILGSYKPDGIISALDAVQDRDGRRLAVFTDVTAGRPKARTRHLHVVDATRPTKPVPLSQLDIVDDPYDVRVAGPTAFIAHSRGVTVVDLSNPSAPAIVGTFGRPQLYSGNRIELADGRVFVSTGESVHVLRVRR